MSRSHESRPRKGKRPPWYTRQYDDPPVKPHTFRIKLPARALWFGVPLHEQPWAPRSKRERVELSEPVDADSRDDDLEGIAAELRLMAYEITCDLARDGAHIRGVP